MDIVGNYNILLLNKYAKTKKVKQNQITNYYMEKYRAMLSFYYWIVKKRRSQLSKTLLLFWRWSGRIIHSLGHA
jgi:hypothetical protein